ncbi:hypothetical protein AB5J62_34430 [Amycolatopsis sp. cg5]|uniref:hypothetical protein n=1 Tax=Amycolatopsis sp. cg5 TaxID=3238802 RepID=UPI0035263536
MGGTRLFAALTAVVLLVAGCTAPIQGAASPDGAAATKQNSPLTLQEALGDPVTVDFCSMLDFAEIGKTHKVIGEPQRSMDRCEFTTNVGGSTAHIMFGTPRDHAADRLGGMMAEPDAGLPRGLRLFRTELAGRPWLYLRFADDTTLQVVGFVESRDPKTETDLVPELAEAESKVLPGVLRALRSPSNVRHVSYPEKSFGHVDACRAVLTDAQVNAETGKTFAGIGPLGRHDCHWGEPWNGPFDVSVEFDTGKPLELRAGATEETIGGRRSIVEGGDGYCSVYTGHLPVRDGRAGDIEQVTLYVSSPKGCDLARTLANAAWPKLPAA